MKNYKNLSHCKLENVHFGGMSGNVPILYDTKKDKRYYIKSGVEEASSEYVFNVLAKILGYPYCKCHMVSAVPDEMTQYLQDVHVIAI